MGRNLLPSPAHSTRSQLARLYGGSTAPDRSSGSGTPSSRQWATLLNSLRLLVLCSPEWIPALGLPACLHRFGGVAMNVLLVEDDGVTAAKIEFILQRQGFAFDCT